MAQASARVMTMYQKQFGAASPESGLARWQIRLAFLFSVGLLAGLAVSPAASNGAAQQGEMRSRVEQMAASADDDPQQMASFQDLIQEEKFAEAEPLLLSYLAAHPGSWKAFYLLGYVQFRQRKIAASVRALAKSLELNVDNAAAHKLLGREFGVIGRTDMAMREFQEALRIEPDAADAHYNIARIYAMEDDFPKAKVELEKAVRRDPNYMQAYNALGFAMEALGDDAASLQDYQTAIRLNEERHGKFDAPYINLSGYYNRRDKLDLAVEYAHKALELNPQSDLAYFQIAKTCRTRGDWAGEAAALERAISIRPASQYYYVLGVAYRKLGKIKESEQALATFQRLQKQTADVDGQRREARRAEHGLELRPTE